MCFWYRAGDLNRLPSIALVTGGDEYGLLDLAVFGKNYSKHQCTGGVRHKDDPFLEKRPSHKIENGCWDYLPYFRPVVEPKPNLPDVLTEPATVSEDIKDRIRQLKTEDCTAVEIATEMTRFTGTEWTHQRVNAILRNL
jgi:hypothetical protein